MFYKFQNDLAGRSGLLNNSLLTGVTAGGAATAGKYAWGSPVAFIGAIILGYRAEVTGGKTTDLLIRDMRKCRKEQTDKLLGRLAGLPAVPYTLSQVDEDLEQLKWCGSLSKVNGALE